MGMLVLYFHILDRPCVLPLSISRFAGQLKFNPAALCYPDLSKMTLKKFKTELQYLH